MRLCSIASGSSGNSIYVGSDHTHILVDAGIPGKRVTEGLHGLDLDIGDIDAILITHEHADHIGGLGVLLRKKNIPVYASKGTIIELLKNKSLGNLAGIPFFEVKEDSPITIGDVTVNPMKISHDAREPLAYRFSNGDAKAAICTDLGEFTDYTVDALKNMNCILLESNHDVRMLQVGPYPYYLKRRILSEHGHLSNESAGKLLNKIAHDDLKYILLGHLSKENNLPQLAYETVRVELDMGDSKYKANDFDLSVASRYERSKILEF